MANVSHASLTGSSLHEPKGADTATAGTVYVSDGAGSGSWADINSLVTSTNFTTGDAKLTLKTTADSGWVMANDGSIGDALSGATTRANADCQALFTLLWTNVSNTWATVSSGRGANAAADWAAHKTITLPKSLGRALAIGGSGSGLTARSLAQFLGNESETLTKAQMPVHNHVASAASESAHTHGVTGTTSTESANHTHTYDKSTATFPAAVGGDGLVSQSTSSQTTSFDSTNHTHTFNVTSASGSAHTHTITVNNEGSGSSHNNMQPTVFFNAMIKL